MAKALSNIARQSLAPPNGFGGKYQISGTVYELGITGSYVVMLFSRKTGAIIKKTVSASTNGSYIFSNIAYIANGYFVVAFDHGANPFNAAIADLITPEPMT